MLVRASAEVKEALKKLHVRPSMCIPLNRKMY